VPGIYDGVERAVAVKVKAFDEHGQVREMEAEGILAVCIQHEMDHLEGTLFIDRLSQLKKEFAKKKLLKARKQEEGK
jgi:peptide deformylase